MTKKLSIIVPVFNDTEGLNKVLESLGNQSLHYEFFEVIVVNNGIDELDIRTEFYSRLNIKIIHEPKPGSYVARNRGISEAKGEIIAFTDSDCFPDLNWLKNGMQLFSLDVKHEIGILTGPVPLFFKNPLALTDAEVYEKYTGFTTEVYAKEGHAITANWFSYKSVLEKFGNFNEQLKSNGDSELSGKISQRYSIIYSQDIIVRHPARYFTSDLVNKNRRILGGTFLRRFQRNNLAFFFYTLKFIYRRYRFSGKKFLTVSFHESWAIFKVCNAINYGALIEFFNLINGAETKR